MRGDAQGQNVRPGLGVVILDYSCTAAPAGLLHFLPAPPCTRELLLQLLLRLGRARLRKLPPTPALLQGLRVFGLLLLRVGQQRRRVGQRARVLGVLSLHHQPRQL
eukprot:SAG22_NODE_1556_length_4131_cov_3.350942_5_plen_106_part_00